jgi:hypothetical protein
MAGISNKPKYGPKTGCPCICGLLLQQQLAKHGHILLLPSLTPDLIPRNFSLSAHELAEGLSVERYYRDSKGLLQEVTRGLSDASNADRIVTAEGLS